MGTRHSAVHHEPARAPPWLPAARQIPLGPLGTAPPLVDLALAVSELAGARRVQTGAQRAQNLFFAFSIDPARRAGITQADIDKAAESDSD